MYVSMDVLFQKRTHGCTLAEPRSVKQELRVGEPFALGMQTEFCAAPSGILEQIVLLFCLEGHELPGGND